MRTGFQYIMVLLAILSITACGAEASSAPTESGYDQGETAEQHGGQADEEHSHDDHEGEDSHDDHEGEHSHEILGEGSDTPFDARYIDTMIEHHLGALRMAERALEESEQPELIELAEKIIERHPKEVDRLTMWRMEWYPDLPATEGMDMGMGAMHVKGNSEKSFDERFLAAMTSHHQAATSMAHEAEQRAEHKDLQKQAAEFILLQEEEIEQMQAWQEQWYGN